MKLTDEDVECICMKFQGQFNKPEFVRAVESEVLRLNGITGDGRGEASPVQDGYALAMAVLQSDLYDRLDDLERVQCDAMIAAAQRQGKHL